MNEDESDFVFSNSQIAALGALAGVTRGQTKKFRSALERAATDFLSGSRHQRRPSPSQVEERLRAIEAACRRLHGLIGCDPWSPPLVRWSRYAMREPAARYAKEVRGRLPGLAKPLAHPLDVIDWLDVISYAILLIGEFSGEAAVAEKKRKRRSKDRHRGEVAVQQLIDDLARIWIECTREPPKATYDPNATAAGKFIGFADACLKSMRQSKHVDVDARSKLRLTRNAIRARLRRSLTFLSIVIERLVHAELIKSREKSA